MKINLGPYISLIDVDCLRFISHWNDGTSSLRIV
jgi:hypothetical protein